MQDEVVSHHIDMPGADIHSHAYVGGVTAVAELHGGKQLAAGMLVAAS